MCFINLVEQFFRTFCEKLTEVLQKKMKLWNVNRWWTDHRNIESNDGKSSLGLWSDDLIMYSAYFNVHNMLELVHSNSIHSFI